MAENMVKIVVPIPEDSTMLSFAGIVATDNDVVTLTNEYDGDEINEMKREYLDLVEDEPETVMGNILTGCLAAFTIILTLFLVFVLVMFVVLWKFPDSSLAIWFDMLLVNITDKMSGLSSVKYIL